jgi:hypothetical protein
MFCFNAVARQIVGKPCEILVESMNISSSTPTELSSIIRLRFTFAISININSYYSRERIFNVNSVIEAHGIQQTLVDKQERVEHEHPEKIDDLPLPLTAQESPATAMQKLSTAPNTTLVRIYHVHITMFYQTQTTYICFFLINTGTQIFDVLPTERHFFRVWTHKQYVHVLLMITLFTSCFVLIVCICVYIKNTP